MIDKNNRIAVIGLGLLGGSYAQGFAQAGYQVIGIDTDASAIELAREKGWIVDGSADPALIEQCDLVISALYPQTFVEWVRENRHHFKSGAILSDVTGIKRMVISQINHLLPAGVEFIATHPMAGRESRGIEYADSSQFANANFIIVSTPFNSERAIQTAEDIAEILGFHRISFLDADEHDRIIGFVSQLCHVIAVSLMNISDDPRLIEYTGDSFRDLTRIANINEELWTQLFIGNKDNLIAQIDNLIAQMTRMRQCILLDDEAQMKQLMKQATERRRKFDKPKK